MEKKYEPLFTPWKIGNVEIKNRIVQPSMGGTSLFGWLEPCHFDREAAYHILNRAQNNVGLVLPGMQCVRDTMGKRWLHTNKQMFKDLFLLSVANVAINVLLSALGVFGLGGIFY